MKKIIAVLLISVICISFAGCASEEENLNANINELNTKVEQLKSEIAELEETRDTLKAEITDIKVESGTAKYIVTLNIKQSHFTLDLSEHLKDSMNDISIQLPVDKEFYDSVNVGDTINDSFRMGSLIFKGSFGSWKVTVEKKEVK